MSGKKYEKYIITEVKPNMNLPSFKHPLPGPKKANLLHLDNEVIEGAHYVECAWFWPGVVFRSKSVAHAHDFDEVIAFFGTDPENPHDLCGEIELELEDETYILTKSCLVFIPKGMKHHLVGALKIDRPIFHFTTGDTPAYH